MKITWEDGYEIERPFGFKLKGLQHNGRRPDAIWYTPEELLQGNIEDSRVDNYIHTVLSGAVTLNGTINGTRRKT